MALVIPVDILGRPISEGDVVARPLRWRASAALAVYRILEIRFIMRNPFGDKPVNVKCSQQNAETYHLRLKPIKTPWNTFSYYNHDTTVRNVQHVLKIPDYDG